MRGRRTRRDQAPHRHRQHRQDLRRADQELTKLDVESVAIEQCDGPLVEALLDADHQVFVITPRQVKGLRSRYSGSGAKSDAGDAYLLADVLRTDGHQLHPDPRQ
ncbi:MAG: transposase [Dermatophilaceae bacterium]